MAGWWFVDASLESGETLLFRRVCVLRRRRRRIVGEVNVTDRRLLFVPGRLDSLTGVATMSVDRADVDHVEVIPPPPGSERFAALPGTPKARAEIDLGGDFWVLQLEDAPALAGVLAAQDNRG